MLAISQAEMQIVLFLAEGCRFGECRLLLSSPASVLCNDVTSPGPVRSHAMTTTQAPAVCISYLGLANFLVNPRFQPTSVGWNLGLTCEFPTSSYLLKKCRSRNFQCYFCISHYCFHTKYATDMGNLGEMFL